MSSGARTTEHKAPTAEAKPEQAPRRPLRVLFVDDDDADVELQRLALRHDFTVEGGRVDTAAAFVEELWYGIELGEVKEHSRLIRAFFVYGGPNGSSP